MHDIAEHLPAEDKAALANTAGAFKAAMPKAAQQHKQLATALTQLGHPGAHWNQRGSELALSVLNGKMNPEDRATLTEAMVNALCSHLGLPDHVAQPELRTVLQQSQSLIGNIQNPAQRMQLAKALSSKLELTSKPEFSEFAQTLPAHLRTVVSSTPQHELVGNMARDLAFTLTSLNRHGLAHLPIEERGAAFEQHITPMEHLKASGFRARIRAFNPTPLASGLIASLPTELQGVARTRVNELSR